VNPESAALEIKQPSRATEIMQQMAIDVKEIGVVAQGSDDMLVPDLGQHCAARLSQGSLPLASQGRRHRR
jgi:hypothetical protein